MKKSLAILALLLSPCLLLSACGKAESTATTVATTEEAPQNSLPAEERYTDETGRYVCKNVAIDTDTQQYFVPYDGGRVQTDLTGAEYTSIGCSIKDWEETSIAVVRKIASESYYTAYEDDRTPLAYTLSTLEIVSLPEGGTNYHNLQIGDRITVVEAYAFSPDAPDVIYRSHIIPSTSYQWGLMELNHSYLVSVTNSLSAIQCSQTGKESSESVKLPDGCYLVAADLYPTDRAVYDAWMSESPVAKDLAIPTAYSEQALKRWSSVYQWAYEQYGTD